MAPPRSSAPPADDEDDLDDLDNLVSEFQSTTVAPNASSSSQPSSSTKPSSGPTAPTAPPAPDDDDDFPDPDDDPLLEMDDEAFAKEIQDGMAQFLASLSDGGGSGGAPGLEDGGDMPGEEDMRKMLEGLLAAGDGAGGNNELLAALGGLAAPQSGTNSTSNVTPQPSTSRSASAAPPPPAAGSFQDTIAASLSKLRDSTATANAETEARASSNSDPMAAMLAQMAGMEGLDGMGEGGLQNMLDEMMGQLMSRELLYTPLKELTEKYPAYLKENGSKLPKADVARYTKQQAIVAKIVAKFEEPGAEKEENLTPEEEKRKKQRSKEVGDLVKEMNECGAPPTEIMGEMPEGMELGPDGTPKLPTDCIVS